MLFKKKKKKKEGKKRKMAKKLRTHRGPGFVPTTHGGTQPSVMSVPGDWVSYSGWCGHIFRQNI